MGLKNSTVSVAATLQIGPSTRFASSSCWLPGSGCSPCSPSSWYCATVLSLRPQFTRRIISELLFAIFVMAGIAQAARMGVSRCNTAAPQSGWRAGGDSASSSDQYRHGGAYLVLAGTQLQNAIIAHDQLSPVLRIPWSVGYGCLSLGLALVGVCSLAAIVRHTLGGEEVFVDLADPGAAVT